MLNHGYDFHECPDCGLKFYTRAIPRDVTDCPCGCALIAVDHPDVPHKDHWPLFCSVWTRDEWDEFCHDTRRQIAREAS